MILRVLLAALAATLLAAAPARAAIVSVGVTPETGTHLGNALTVKGHVTEAGVPVAGRPVQLEVLRFPYKGAFAPRGTAVTAADGSYSFVRKLDRDHQIRVRLLPDPAGTLPGEALSPIVTGFVMPVFTLAFEQLSGGRILITQTYRVPKDLTRFRAVTRFYLGRKGARRAALKATVTPKRKRPGRFVASAKVKIPASYGGRFAYASCFEYAKGSGMGAPTFGCPRRSFTLR